MNELSDGSTARRARTWLPLPVPTRVAGLAAVLGSVLVLWFSIPPLVSLNFFWLRDSDYTHGYVVALLTAMLVCREIQRGSFQLVGPSWIGALALSVCSAVVIGGYAATTLVVPLTALPAVWVCSIWAFAGAERARRFALPIGYLYFAVPIWSVLVDPLRRLTIHVVSGWTRAAGMPAYIEGNLIHVPTGTFEIKGGCAGVGYVLVALALATLSSLLSRRRWVPTVLFASCAVVLALVGNWFRVFFTVAAGLHPEGKLALFVHTTIHCAAGCCSRCSWCRCSIWIEYSSHLLLRRAEAIGSQSRSSAPGTARSSLAYAICAFTRYRDLALVSCQRARG